MEIQKKYQENKDAKVGADLSCPSCGSKFKKESYQQAFCKSLGKTKCKDKYWNTVDDSKRNNTNRLKQKNPKAEITLKLLSDFEKRNNLSIKVNLYSDGSGFVKEFWDGEELIEFKSTDELSKFLTETNYKKDSKGLAFSPVQIIEEKPPENGLS